MNYNIDDCRPDDSECWDRVKDSYALLPTWMTERMMNDSWSFGLLTSTGHLICINSIDKITRDVNGDIWLTVTLMSHDCAPDIGDNCKVVCAFCSNDQATVAARHIVLAVELKGT